MSLLSIALRFMTISLYSSSRQGVTSQNYPKVAQRLTFTLRPSYVHVCTCIVSVPYVSRYTTEGGPRSRDVFLDHIFLKYQSDSVIFVPIFDF